ncbi:hypothetical protein ILUMI_25856 [Ignelater luminosus]|uniref:Uncharacterized protein n=1 Tax=Ignelater luminosus TaxID=2038154 RepID=A0A8K0C4Z6_IGNLU|nr:hypothetical protein ILUMI_25856 [Ignelater luminosus]
MTADHFIANITDKAKRSGEFAITPVEIVVGNARTKIKKTKKKEEEEHVCCCNLKKWQNKSAPKKEAARIAKLGRFEYYTLSNGDAILRGTNSQTWQGYSAASQGNQDIPNCLAAFVIHRMNPVNNWHYKHIDLILDIGDQLYKDSKTKTKKDVATKLNKAAKALRMLINEERNASITKYLEELSATKITEYSLWKATKKIKQPQQHIPPIKIKGSRDEKENRKFNYDALLNDDRFTKKWWIDSPESGNERPDSIDRKDRQVINVSKRSQPEGHICTTMRIA